MIRDYSNSTLIPDGLMALQGSEPVGLLRFVILMGVMTMLSLYALNVRKLGILKEAYSTLSIFKK